MGSAISVAPVAILLFALSVGMVVGLASHKLTWTEIILGVTFGLLLGSLAGDGLAANVNGAIADVFHATGH